MSGTIGLAAQDASRYTEFSLSLARLDRPQSWEIFGALNYDLSHARNFLAENFVGDYLWLIDDDMTFEPNVLTRLLARNLDIVGPLYAGRRPPFPAYAKRDGEWITLDGRPGLEKVDETGGAGLLIKRRVLERMERPWFSHGTQSDGSHVADDAYFCRKAREAGFKIHVDTSIVMGHTALVQIEPEFGENGWQTKLDIGGFAVRVPQEVFA